MPLLWSILLRTLLALVVGFQRGNCDLVGKWGNVDLYSVSAASLSLF